MEQQVGSYVSSDESLMDSVMYGGVSGAPLNISKKFGGPEAGDARKLLICVMGCASSGYRGAEGDG